MKRILLLILILAFLPTDPASADTRDFSAAWATADSLIDLGQWRTADTVVVAILAHARQADDQEQWARALIERVRLQSALNAPETAVRDLRAQAWPTDPLWRGAVELFHAHALIQYQARYSYEIRRREKVATTDSLDLKIWTTEELSREINGSLQRVWAQRSRWGNESLGVWSRFLVQNNYPARIRGTLRDAVSYLWVKHLANTSLWLPGQQEEVRRLDLELLLSGPTNAAVVWDLADPRVHPLLRLSFILRDLRDWHRQHRQPEAALEAELENLDRLDQAIRYQPDRIRLRQYLGTRLVEFDHSYPWWSFGQWRLARLINRENTPDSMLRAHLAAQQGQRRHPERLGGRLCADILVEIEQPSFNLTAMTHDAAQRRSIQIRHRNLERLYFQAWPLDLPAIVSRPQGPRLSRARIDSIVQETAAVLHWTVDLPRTEDYQQHQTYTGLPACGPGTYLVVASERRDFDPDASRLAGVMITIGDLLITTQQLGDRIEVFARSAATGEPRARVKLVVYSARSRNRPAERVVRHLVTDNSGRARFTSGDQRHFQVLARQGKDVAWLDNGWVSRRSTSPGFTNAFVYTDRGVYRPGQTVHWKVVAYEGNATRTEFQTLGNQDLTVSLLNANRQEVERTSHKTNDFGSTSGSFVIPSGGLLGSWQLTASLGGSHFIRVEQYKRPTFEVRLLDPAVVLELNRPAALSGQADYLFDSPVTTGTVKWRVTRVVQPRYSWWSLPFDGTKTVADGSAELDSQGRFHLEFKTDVDPRLATDAPVTYRYAVEADVTNEGGETRTTKRVFNLGFTTIQARITTENNFVRAGQPARFTVRRLDLNGIARPGKGQWALYALIQPDSVLLPADKPLTVPDNPRLLSRTPGDLQSPRWQQGRGGIRDLHEWATGDRIAGGALEHGPDGLAKIELPHPPAGPLRLVYATDDTNGHPSETRHEFISTGRAELPLNLPLVLMAERDRVAVGDTARFLLHSGWADQPLYVQIFVGGERTRAVVIRTGQDPEILTIPVTPAAHRGLTVRVSGLQDHQHLTDSRSVRVPWDRMQLDISFATFRDRLAPGTDESFTVTIRSRDGTLLNARTTELLAYMYDRSLDQFGRNRLPRPLSGFAGTRSIPRQKICAGHGNAVWRSPGGLNSRRVTERPQPDYLQIWPRLGINARSGRFYVRGGRSGMMANDIDPVLAASLAAEGTELLQAFDVEGASYMVEVKSALSSAPGTAETFEKYAIDSAEDALAKQAGVVMHAGGRAAAPPPVQLRQNFAETGFWLPHVKLTDGGTATVTFKVPDSVTDWNVWLHALTRDLHSGTAHRSAASIKDLMVRPYLPRFLREGDTARLKVVVDNAGTTPLRGRVELVILNPDSGEDLSTRFGLAGGPAAFTVDPGRGSDLVFDLRVPAGVGSVVVRAVARAGSLSDGEQRELPILPGRMHLVQSRLVALSGQDRREMSFPLMASDRDATRVQGQLVITVDGQLFGSVLAALPYLVQYPFECTEQTLNRYLSTSILAGVYAEHPSVRAMADSLSDRTTITESWHRQDPNRRLLLEESPWLQIACGGSSHGALLNLLEPTTVSDLRQASLARLEQLQDAEGGFPWFPGGRPSPHVTLTVLLGLARGAEFGVEAPDRLAARAWRYLHRYYESELRTELEDVDYCPVLSTMLNYLLSSYPENVWQAAGFTGDDRERMLAQSFRHWREQSRLLSGYLALTLRRAGRSDDARLVFAKVMDGALTDPDLGTYWAPEDRAWLWYNDTVESHAFALRVLSELDPSDPRRQGLAQWLLLNKKLGHWKSTRATAEAIYALVYFMAQDGSLDVAETIDVTCGPFAERFDFKPGVYSGGHNQIIYAGQQIDPQSMATVVVTKETPGLGFASATWHFSTEQLPEQATGDLFSVSRRFFRRVHDGTRWVLQPLARGDSVAVGDQIEVQLSITARQAADYVHLRDPRAAGCEPEGTTSGYRRQTRLGYYEEVRDSGTNFFFDRLPTGQYTLKYRLRANLAGSFKVGPATLQSLYAPEFAAYSAGRELMVGP